MAQERPKRTDAGYCEEVSGYLAERRPYNHKPSTRLPRQRFLTLLSRQRVLRNIGAASGVNEPVEESMEIMGKGSCDR